jgi:arylsulfatase A-like enzyme
LLAREAVRVITAQPKSKPLFLYLAFNAVHSPHQAPAEYKQPYAHLPEPRRTYAGMLAAMDEAVGKVVSAIEQTGRRKNTLFVFSSDNGGPRPGIVTTNGPLRAGKGTVYEGGVRVAAFATWDDRIPPRQIQTPMHMVDWYATLLRLCGAPTKQKLPVDGRDIWPCLTRGKSRPQDEIVLNIAPNNGAIRVGDWKLVVNDGDNRQRRRRNNTNETAKVELFNLSEDPGEKKNLADAEPRRVKKLRERYDELAAQAVPPKNRE